MKNVLLIINGPAYGSDETFNAVRLAVALAQREDAAPRLFLMGDAVTSAVAGQQTPDGYYTLDRMLKGFARHGGQIACCGTCLDARGLTEQHLIPEASHSTMDALAAWTAEHDQVLVLSGSPAAPSSGGCVSRLPGFSGWRVEGSGRHAGALHSSATAAAACSPASRGREPSAPDRGRPWQWGACGPT